MHTGALLVTYCDFVCRSSFSCVFLFKSFDNEALTAEKYLNLYWMSFLLTFLINSFKCFVISCISYCGLPVVLKMDRQEN